MTPSWQELLIDGLACFRLAVLLSIDTGPWKMFTMFRSWLKREAREHKAVKKSDVASGIDCPRCTSVHLAFLIGSFAYFKERLPSWLQITGEVFLLCMALSAIAILLNRIPKQ